MKKQLLTIILALILSPVFAQENDSELFTSNSSFHEVGIDATGIISLIGAGNIYFSPYYLNYKFYHNKHSFHLGLGGTVGSSTETDDQYDNQELENKNSDFRIGVGYNYNHQLGTKWLVHYGLEFSYNRREFINQYNSSYGITSQVQDRVSYGIGPNIGIRYKLSDHIAIGTETYYFVNYFNFRHGHEYPEGTNDDMFSEEIGWNTYYYPPYHILLTIRF